MESYKILIVDDDPNIREVLSVLLGSEGYSVQQAENGETALEIVNGGRPLDLVILDIMMPGLSGVEVCTKIRETSSVPVLFLTAKSQDQDKIEAYNPVSYTHLDVYKRQAAGIRRGEYRSGPCYGGYQRREADFRRRGFVSVPGTDSPGKGHHTKPSRSRGPPVSYTHLDVYKRQVLQGPVWYGA